MHPYIELSAPVILVAVWLVAVSVPGAPLVRWLREPEDRMLLTSGVVALAVFAIVWLLGRYGPTEPITLRAITWVCLLALVAGIALAVVGFRRMDPSGRSRSWLPIALTAALVLVASYLITVGLGLLWSGPGTIVEIAERRYLFLPGDNLLPQIFSAGLRNANVPSPMMGDWYSADRPPLQTGYLLLFEKALDKLIHPDAFNADSLLGIACQSLFVIAVLRFVRTLTGSLAVGAVAAVATILVPATGIYGFFAWPKLLAAAFLMTALALTFDLLRPSRRRLTSPRALAVAWGIAVSLAALSHGGVIFSIIPLAVLFLIACVRAARTLPQRLGLIACAAVSLVATYLPWSVYGKVTGEDHGRLIKWHFAGDIAPSTTPALTVIERAYSGLTFSQWFDMRRANFDTVFRNANAPRSLESLWATFTNATTWRVVEFQALPFTMAIAVVWLLPLVLLLCTSRRQRLSDISALTLVTIAWVLATIVVWCLLLFGAGATLPHQGSVAVIFLPAMIGAMLVTRLSFRIGLVVLAIQAVVFTYEMLPPMDMTFDGMPPASAISHVAIALALSGAGAAVAGIAVARRADQRAERQMAVGTTSPQSDSA